MLFNSFEFIFLFLPITLVFYFLIANLLSDKIAKTWLVIASLYFYSYFNKLYLLLIVTSILINYAFGNVFHNKELIGVKRRLLLFLAVVLNIGALFYFKYYDFFILNINFMFRMELRLLKLLLPLGISFFTFQQLSFVIDSYYNRSLKYDFLSYSLFVTFFPQLIAGPIVLPCEMLTQFESKKNKKFNYANFNKAYFLFSIGLAKKVLIADSLSNFVDTGFNRVASLTFLEAWITSLSYTSQLYFDFSGYCDMAMGIALMFNIVLPQNFHSPYKAKNIQEFWKRWHITLGRFFTNYLYIPLGGNKEGDLKTYRNMIIVFLGSGIWHGAGWTFIIWGCLHGVSILLHRVWKKSGNQLNKTVAWLLTFTFVNIFWIFFRAKTLKGAINITTSLFDINSINRFITNDFKEAVDSALGFEMIMIVLIISYAIIVFAKNSVERADNLKLKNSTIVEKFIYFFGSLLFLNRVVEFLYFNF